MKYLKGVDNLYTAKYIDSKWYIETYVEEFKENVLMLQKCTLVPWSFDTKEDAEIHMKTLNKYNSELCL